MFVWTIFAFGMFLAFFLIIWPHKHVEKINIDRQKNSWLVTSGPYKLIRHPEYGGEIIFCLSCLFLIILIGERTIMIWVVCLSLVWYIWCIIRKSLKEEIVLRKKFGQAAEDYFARTRKRWIPFLI